MYAGFSKVRDPYFGVLTVCFIAYRCYLGGPSHGNLHIHNDPQIGMMSFPFCGGQGPYMKGTCIVRMNIETAVLAHLHATLTGSARQDIG